MKLAAFVGFVPLNGVSREKWPSIPMKCSFMSDDSIQGLKKCAWRSHIGMVIHHPVNGILNMAGLRIVPYFDKLEVDI